jgi:hypothetical protein
MESNNRERKREGIKKRDRDKVTTYKQKGTQKQKKMEVTGIK